MATMAQARPRVMAWERYAPLAGVVSVVLWVIGALIQQGAIKDKTPETLLSSYTQKEGRILLGGLIWLIGIVFFFWFLGSLRATLAAAEGGVLRLTTIAFAGGVGAAICGLLFVGPDMGAAITDDQDLSAPVAEAVRVVGNAFFIGAEIALAVLLIATAGVVFRTRVLPVWIAWISVIIGIALIVLPIGWAVLLFGFPIWVLIVTYLLWSGGQVVPRSPV
jgi:hypothetical protein